MSAPSIATTDGRIPESWNFADALSVLISRRRTGVPGRTALRQTSSWVPIAVRPENV